MNCEDFYISPGIIDLSVRREWEDYNHLTKAAVSGGVSFLLEEIGYYINQLSTGELFCDLGKLATLDLNNLDQISEMATQGYFGYKAYLYPPSSSIEGVPANLSPIFSEVARQQKCLFIDPTLPNPRMLYIASPMRLMSFSERFQSGNSSSASRVFAAAFPDTLESEESDKDEDEIPLNRRCRRMTINYSESFIPLKNRCNSEIGLDHTEKAENEIRIEPITEVVDEEDSPKRPRKTPHTIFDDLDKRIKDSHLNIESLSLAEQFTYKNSGSTNFRCLSPVQYKNDENNIDNEYRKQGSSYASRIAKRRPPPLSVKQEEKKDKEQTYLYHLANYPDHWETTGIERIIKELKKVTCRVHITNISSASAVNRVRQAKEEFPSLTCEVSASQLSFTSAAIKNGDTRFKTSALIRNQTNLMLLWDLLKMQAIDSISSQHASIKPEFKSLDTGNFQQALNGITSIGFTLQSVWTMLNVPASTNAQLEHYIVRLAK